MAHFRAVMASVIVSVVLVSTSAAVLAHHSISGEFDSSKRVKVTGVISKIEWVNPHIYFYVDSTDAAGQITTWTFETIPTAAMRKAGVTAEMLRGGGAVVVVDGYPANDGTAHLALVLKVTYPDGHQYQLFNDPDKDKV
jgi:hypothetical protein